MALTAVTASSERPGTAVVAIGGLSALACIGFAVVNIVFVLTDRFADGDYAQYSSGLNAMNWLVVVLKLVGAAAALLSLARRPRFLSPTALGLLLWGAFALLGLYALGSVAEAAAMLTGLAGDADEITLAGVAYVSFFLLLAAGYGVLAISHSRRFGFQKRLVVLGALGAPALLGLILLAVPAVLAAFGMLPS